MPSSSHQQQHSASHRKGKVGQVTTQQLIASARALTAHHVSPLTRPEPDSEQHDTSYVFVSVRSQPRDQLPSLNGNISTDSCGSTDGGFQLVTNGSDHANANMMGDDNPPSSQTNPIFEQTFSNLHLPIRPVYEPHHDHNDNDNAEKAGVVGGDNNGRVTRDSGLGNTLSPANATSSSTNRSPSPRHGIRKEFDRLTKATKEAGKRLHNKGGKKPERNFVLPKGKGPGHAVPVTGRPPRPPPPSSGSHRQSSDSQSTDQMQTPSPSSPIPPPRRSRVELADGGSHADEENVGDSTDGVGSSQSHGGSSSLLNVSQFGRRHTSPGAPAPRSRNLHWLLGQPTQPRSSGGPMTMAPLALAVNVAEDDETAGSGYDGNQQYLGGMHHAASSAFNFNAGGGQQPGLPGRCTSVPNQRVYDESFATMAPSQITLQSQRQRLEQFEQHSNKVEADENDIKTDIDQLENFVRVKSGELGLDANDPSAVTNNVATLKNDIASLEREIQQLRFDLRIPPPLPPKPPKPGSMPTGSSTESGGGGEHWSCVQCTYLNFPDLFRCETCQLPRIVAKPAEVALMNATGYAVTPSVVSDCKCLAEHHHPQQTSSGDTTRACVGSNASPGKVCAPPLLGSSRPIDDSSNSTGSESTPADWVVVEVQPPNLGRPVCGATPTPTDDHAQPSRRGFACISNQSSD